VLENFVGVLENCEFKPLNLSEAMVEVNAMVAKEKALTSFTTLMEKGMDPSGMDASEFDSLVERTVSEVEVSFRKSAIYGNDERIKQAWEDTVTSINRFKAQYLKDNELRLQQALIGFAHITFLGVALFVIDRISDFTCDWWSHTCTAFSKAALLAYVAIFGYVAFFGYLLYAKQGKVALGLALAELGKELVRLMGVYSEWLESLKLQVLVTKLVPIMKKVFVEKKSLDVAFEETGVTGNRAKTD